MRCDVVAQGIVNAAKEVRHIPASACFVSALYHPVLLCQHSKGQVLLVMLSRVLKGPLVGTCMSQCAHQSC